MKSRVPTCVALSVPCVLILTFATRQTSSAASATVTDIPEPDTYTCDQSGYVDFEPMPDSTDLSPFAINGIQFTTTNGFTWRVGDFSTGLYNGKYPSGGYTSQGTHWAWLGLTQGEGRIDLVDGPGSTFSLLTSVNLAPVRLDAYSADDTLIATAGPSSMNYETGHMDELKITRDTADIAYVVVHDAGNYFLVDAICTDAPGVPNQALHDFKQNRNADGSKVPWADDRIFDLGYCGTFEGYGCAIASLTDVLASYELNNLPNGAPVDPGEMNHYLGLPSNASTHSGCDIVWSTAAKALGFDVFDYRPRTTSYDARIARIDEALDANNLVIVGFPSGDEKHFVVLYLRGADAPDGSPDYLIVDPLRDPPDATGDHSGKTLYQAYNRTLKEMGSVFQVDVVVNRSPDPGRAWAIVAHSPVEMLITDPSGAQTGFNPATGSYVLDIAGSSYGPGDGIGDDTGTNPPIPDILYFGQNHLDDGEYVVQVIGTGAGPYALDFNVASGPMEGSVQTVAGTATPGLIDTYLVTVTEGQPLVIELEATQVTIDIKPGSDLNPIDCDNDKGIVTVAILTTQTFDALTVDHASVTFEGAHEAHVDKKTGEPRRHEEDVDGDGDLDLVFHFRLGDTNLNCDSTAGLLTGDTFDGRSIEGVDDLRMIGQGGSLP